MNEKLFQDIYEKIEEFLPNRWEKVAFYAGYTAGSYSMKYYVDNGSGEYIDCFSLPNVKKPQLIQLFMSIDKIITPVRKSFDDQNKWTVLSMIIDSNGKMKTDFDYCDISENAISYEKEWKKKYLGIKSQT